MKTLLSTLILSSLFLSTSALACSYPMPSFSFIQTFDENDDNQLSLQEWQQVEDSEKAANYRMDSLLNSDKKLRIGSVATFRALDTNKDNQLTSDELAQYIYLNYDPCPGFGSYL